VVQITSFLSSARRLEFPLFWWWHRGSPAVTVGSPGSLCTGGVDFLAPVALWIVTQWKSLDSSSLTGETWLLHEVQNEGLCFCVPLGKRASSVTCRVAGFSFPPLSGESGILLLWRGSKCSLPVSRDTVLGLHDMWGESLLVPAD
jgi:hypothetical protein